MPAMAAPLAAHNFGAWETWVGELTGSRKAEFDEMNARHGLTEHRAYLQPTPDGNYLVLVVYEGSGADDFIGSVMASDHEFDRWFAQSVASIHELDPTAPMPPLARRRI